jgi:hypothetical protein
MCVDTHMKRQMTIFHAHYNAQKNEHTSHLMFQEGESRKDFVNPHH